MGTDKALAGVFHSPEPAASDLDAPPLLHRSHFHCAWVPGQETVTTHRAEASPASCLYEPTSAKSMGGEKKNPTAVISCDKQSKSSAANQRANLCAAGLGCLLPSSVVLAEMESSTTITSVPEGCTKTGGAHGSGTIPPAESGVRE